MTTPEPEWVREIEPGKAYLIGVPKHTSRADADLMYRKLAERFPLSTFGFVGGAESLTPLTDSALENLVRGMVRRCLAEEEGKP